MRLCSGAPVEVPRVGASVEVRAYILLLLSFLPPMIFGRRTIPYHKMIRVVFYIDTLRRKPPSSTIIFKVLSSRRNEN